MSKKTIVMVVLILICYSVPAMAEEKGTGAIPAWLNEVKTDNDTFKPNFFDGKGIERDKVKYIGRRYTLAVHVRELSRKYDTWFVKAMWVGADITFALHSKTRIDLNDLLIVNFVITDMHGHPSRYIKTSNCTIIKHAKTANSKPIPRSSKEELSEILQYLKTRAVRDAKLTATINRAIELADKLEDR